MPRKITVSRSGRPLMKTRQAANYLQMGENTLAKNRMNEGDIPYLKIGGSVRYDPDKLDEYLEKKGINHGSDAESNKNK